MGHTCAFDRLDSTLGNGTEQKVASIPNSYGKRGDGSRRWDTSSLLSPPRERELIMGLFTSTNLLHTYLHLYIS
jgi:hypothetical protein